MRYLKWLLTRIAAPNALRLILVVALSLALPSLFAPLVADDHVQALKYRQWAHCPTRASIFDLLADYTRFVSGDLAANHEVMEQGLGWWMAPDLKLAFFRPISAATHVIDHLLWPGNALLMHLHSLLWFLGLLLALSALFRRLLPPLTANLALCLFAVDDARGMVLSWVANRNALIAALFGVGVMLIHERWRREGFRPGAYLGPLLLAFGLLSAEIGLSAVGYVVAYALCLDRGPLSRRLLTLLPYAFVVALWQAAYLAHGYGAAATGMYAHPLRDPWVFTQALIERAPVLLLAQLTPFPADTWFLLPRLAKVAVYVVALGVPLGVASLAKLRAVKPEECRFFCLASAFCLLPIAATLPSDRNLVFVGAGAAAALATLLVGAAQSPGLSRLQKLAAGSLVLFNLVVAPVTLPLKCLSTFGIKHLLTAAERTVPREAAIAERSLVVVWTATEGPLSFAWSQRDAEGVPKPKRSRILAVCHGDVAITRLDEYTLRVRPQNGYLDHVVHHLGRDSSRPFRLGETIALTNLVATVTELADGWRPQTVEFRFTSPLESPEWLWMRGEGLGYVPWSPPRVTETVVIRGK